MKNLAEQIVDQLLEADIGQFQKYYEPYGAKLADHLETQGYDLSLWVYPEKELYEVNIGHGGADWSDPQTHTAPHHGGFTIPKAVINKIREWLSAHGHLVMGTHSERHAAVYKRLFQRMGAKIVDVTWPIPGGGHYFFAITTDTDAPERCRRADMGESRLSETGEADQDYDHGPLDAIVRELDYNGIKGTTHREFDKYQGIYLRIPGVDKFWAIDGYWGGLVIVAPEDDPDVNIPVTTWKVEGGEWNADVERLVEYCKKVNYELRIRSAHQAGEEEGRDFITQMAAEEPPQQRKRRSIRPKG